MKNSKIGMRILGGAEMAICGCENTVHGHGKPCGDQVMDPNEGLCKKCRDAKAEEEFGTTLPHVTYTPSR